MPKREGLSEQMSHATRACLQLRVKIAKQQAAKEQKLRKKNLTKYIPNAAYAIYRVLQSMSETAAVSPHAVSHVCEPPASANTS